MQRCFSGRKHPRLKNKHIYDQLNTTVHVVICTANRDPFFSNPEAANLMIDTLRSVAAETNNRIYAYCIMPDHLHLLLATSLQVGIIDFIKLLKGRFSTGCRKRKLHVRLQPSFYDHVLRKEEDVKATAEYILNNPVRAGIVGSAEQYPYMGSLVW